METRDITVRVPSDVARLYEDASPEERQKLDALISIWLRQVEHPQRTLEEVMEDASAQARAAGLTPEKLRELLDE